MKTKNIKIAIGLIISVLINSACSDSSDNKYKLPKPYSIRISNDLDQTQADSLKNSLQNLISDSLYLIIDDDYYTVNLGYFNSSIIAGEKAYNLFCDSIINGYQIYYGDSVKVYDEYRYIPYLGMDLNRPALFKYDLVKKTSRLIWSKWGRKILNFTYPKNFGPAYFITALTFGRNAGFPYITDVRAYKYNIYDNSVKRLDKIGKGLQVFSDFDSLWNYNVYFNILDSANTSSIIQLKNIYNTKGNKIESSEKIFNILNDGYPVPKLTLPRLISPSKKFYLKAEGNDSIIHYFLNNYKQNTRDLVNSSDMELSKIEWNRNEEYLMLSYKDAEVNNNSKLIIIKTETAELVYEFKNNGAVNFIVHGDLLIFDIWNKQSSKIFIYNYKNETYYDSLSIAGGCGLNYIKSEFIGY